MEHYMHARARPSRVATGVPFTLLPHLHGLLRLDVFRQLGNEICTMVATASLDVKIMLVGLEQGARIVNFFTTSIEQPGT